MGVCRLYRMLSTNMMDCTREGNMMIQNTKQAYEENMLTWSYSKLSQFVCITTVFNTNLIYLCPKRLHKYLTEGEECQMKFPELIVPPFILQI